MAERKRGGGREGRRGGQMRYGREGGEQLGRRNGRREEKEESDEGRRRERGRDTSSARQLVVQTGLLPQYNIEVWSSFDNLDVEHWRNRYALHWYRLHRRGAADHLKTSMPPETMASWTSCVFYLSPFVSVPADEHVHNTQRHHTAQPLPAPGRRLLREPEPSSKERSEHLQIRPRVISYAPFLRAPTQ